MKSIEKIVNHMLSMSAFSKLRVLIEKKCEEYEELISLLPDSDEHLAEAARAKVVSMYSRLYNTSPNSSEVTHSSDVSSDNSIVVPGIKHFCNLSSSGAKEIHIPSDKPKSTANESEFSLALLPTPTEPPLSSASNSTERSSSSQSKGRFDLEKCKLRYEIEASFARLSPIESGSDVEAVKTLLVETAKARTKLASYQKDDRLHSIIFNLAFKKLQLKMRDQFLAIYGPHLGGISLCNLVNFLQAEIVAQNAKTVNLVNKILYSKDKGQRSTFQKSMNEVLIRCKYCKSRGHVRDDCPCVKGLLCFKCYRTGHTKPTCPQYTFC